MGIRARVIDGRLVVDEPTDLPEGTVLDLVLDDEGDDLGERDNAALRAAIAASRQQAAKGDVREADAFLEELRRRR